MLVDFSPTNSVTDVSTIAATNSPPARPELPPIRIHHFLAWMAVMAVMLTFSSLQATASDSRFASPLQPAFVAIGVVTTVLGSLAVTIVLFGYSWYRRGLPFFAQPGQWLLVAMAVPTALSFLRLALLPIVQFSGIPMPAFAGAVVLLLAMLGMSIFSAVLNIYIGSEKIHLPVWRRVFYSKAVASIVPVLGDLAVAIFLERAVRANRRDHPLRQTFAPTAPTTAPPLVQYHWTHWVGVVLQFLHIGFAWLILVAVIAMMIYGASNR